MNFRAKKLSEQFVCTLESRRIGRNKTATSFACQLKGRNPTERRKVYLLLAVICLIAIPLIAVAQGNQKPDQTKTDANAPYQILTETPKSLGPFPQGEQPKVAPVEPRPIKVQPAYPVQATGYENSVWDFLIGQGFTRNQVAGIMGNLQQEHGFQTSGDGLAQWNGGRKAKLLAMGNPYSIETQLSFLMIELNGPYIGIKESILSTNDIVSVTQIFQNHFEGCSMCMEGSRINYAYEILERH